MDLEKELLKIISIYYILAFKQKKKSKSRHQEKYLYFKKIDIMA